MHIPRRLAAAILGAVLLGGMVAPCRASDDTAAAEETWRDGWKFSFIPYLWLPAETGTIGLAGKTAAVDVSMKDVLDLMGDHLSLIAGFFHLEAQRRRLFTFIDATLTSLDTDGSTSIATKDFGGVYFDGSLKQNVAILEFAGGYRLLELALPQRVRPMTIEAFAGARYYYFWTQLKVTATNARLGSASRRATGDLDWWDPMIGGRFAVPIMDKLDLQVRGDIGGFGAGSDLAWSMVGFLRYNFDSRPFGITPSIGVGYKVLDFDWKDGGREMDLNIAGPAIGIDLAF